MILNTDIVLNKGNCYALSDLRSLPIRFSSQTDSNPQGKLLVRKTFDELGSTRDSMIETGDLSPQEYQEKVKAFIRGL